jgi:hypothetical protein
LQEEIAIRIPHERSGQVHINCFILERRKLCQETEETKTNPQSSKTNINDRLKKTTKRRESEVGRIPIKKDHPHNTSL